ncbi:SurA N-terminal domain-containing protein [Methylopila sp. M107]|uniref:SurA N-terminal domain-containing protein n=1 Tax=Methylopila sp. M107 TaxID=1101190 RepID=UPI00036E29FD|nr:SurA N-terminal domain-containing protein [Methylopila sp. M107]
MVPTPRTRLLALAFAPLCLAALGAAPAAAQSIAVVVNGQPILTSEVAARAALTKLSGGKPAQSTQDELIEEKLKMMEAQRYGMLPPDSQVEAAFASIAQRTKLTPENFSKAIQQRGVNPQTLKDRIKAEIGWAQLIRRKYAAQLAQKSVAMAMTTGGGSNKATQYTLRQVIFVVPKGASDAQANQRRSEAIGARGRFPGCDGAVQFGAALRDVAVKEPVIRSSAQIGKDLAGSLDKVKLGGLTEPQRGDQGWEMIAVCARKEIADDDAMRTNALEQVGSKEAEAKSKQYLDQIKARAVIVRR